MDTITAPSVGISPTGFHHAARTEQMDEQGWAPALCRSTLWVSVDHTTVTFTEDGVWRSRSVPLEAWAEGFPRFNEGHNMTGTAVDCLSCSRALARMGR